MRNLFGLIILKESTNYSWMSLSLIASTLLIGLLGIIILMYKKTGVKDQKREEHEDEEKDVNE
jgi:hypothetical protein